MGASRRHHRPTDEAQAPEQNAGQAPGDTTAVRLAARPVAAPDDTPAMGSAVVRSRSPAASCCLDFRPDARCQVREAYTRAVLWPPVRADSLAAT